MAMRLSGIDRRQCCRRSQDVTPLRTGTNVVWPDAQSRFTLAVISDLLLGYWPNEYFEKPPMRRGAVEQTVGPAADPRALPNPTAVRAISRRPVYQVGHALDE